MIKHSSSHVLPEDFDFIQALAQRNFVGQGLISESFVVSLMRRFGRARCLLTSSGTSALEIALHVNRHRRPQACDVIVSAYVCPAVVSAVLREGLRPVFVDVQAGSMNLDAGAVARVLGEQTLAVVMTHVGGIADPVAELQALNVPIISDCAQALGTTWGGKALTAFGEASVTSFGATKMLTAGSGGALLADDESFFASAVRHAAEELPVQDYVETGFSPTYGQHFSELAAGLGQAQLRRFDVMLARRQEVALRYTKLLTSCDGIELMEIPDGCSPNNFRYCFFTSFAPEWLRLLRENGVDARPSISHNMTEYFPCGLVTPNLAHNSRRLVSLPIHAALSEEEVERVLTALRSGFSAGLR